MSSVEDRRDSPDQIMTDFNRRAAAQGGTCGISTFQQIKSLINASDEERANFKRRGGGKLALQIVDSFAARIRQLHSTPEAPTANGDDVVARVRSGSTNVEDLLPAELSIFVNGVLDILTRPDAPDFLLLLQQLGITEARFNQLMERVTGDGKRGDASANVPATPKPSAAAAPPKVASLTVKAPALRVGSSEAEAVFARFQDAGARPLLFDLSEPEIELFMEAVGARCHNGTDNQALRATLELCGVPLSTYHEIADPIARKRALRRYQQQHGAVDSADADADGDAPRKSARPARAEVERQNILEHPTGRAAFLVAWHALPSYFEDPTAARNKLATVFCIAPQDVAALQGATVPRIAFRDVKTMERRRHDPAVRQAVVTLQGLLATCGLNRSQSRFLEVFDLSQPGVHGWAAETHYDLSSIEWSEPPPPAEPTLIDPQPHSGALDAAAQGDVDEGPALDGGSPHDKLNHLLGSMGLSAPALGNDGVGRTSDAEPVEGVSAASGGDVVEPEQLSEGNNGRIVHPNVSLKDQNVALTRENATLRESLEQQVGELRELMRKLTQKAGPDAPHVISIQRTTGEQVIEVVLKIRVSGSESGGAVSVEV